MKLLTALATGLFGCITAGCAITPTSGETIDLHGQKVPLTLIHTADIHSRVFPYEYTPLQPDIQAGLVPGKGPYGGVAKVAYIVARERANADRAIHLDGGDAFQGAPIFNYFNGQAEMRALAQMGTDAMVVANHDFDRGALNLFTQIEDWANFPTLAANYRADDPGFSGAVPIGAVLSPYTVLNVRGLRVGVIGMGNLSTLSALFQEPNNLGLTPYKTNEIAQFYVDLLRPQVDLIVMLTHLGLEVDQQMIQETEGIDIVLGGHNHIVVSPPQVQFDCGGQDAEQGYVMVPQGETGVPAPRYCKPRKVLLMHSGAFAKFVGRLDVVVTDDAATINQANNKPDGWYDPVNGFEVVSHTQQIIPIDDEVPEDQAMSALLEPYKQALANVGNLDLLVGYAPNDVKRKAPNGGDSQLGNLVSTSMWLRLGVQTDLAMTNTTGIRADLPQGPVTVEQMFNVFPFDNSITKMEVSGEEMFELFDYAARRSAARACESQVQIAGSFIVMNCSDCDPDLRPDFRDPTAKACAEQIFVGYTSASCAKDDDCGYPGKSARFSCDTSIGRCRSAIYNEGSYELATNNYLAAGGSGYLVLQHNTTQLDTKIQQRDAVTDLVRFGDPCGYVHPTCTTNADCPSNGICQSNGTCSIGDLIACTTDADCAGSIGSEYVCACPEASTPTTPDTSQQITCGSTSACGSDGRCILGSCRDDVAQFHNDEDCVGSTGDTLHTCRANACSQSGEQCKVLACLDDKIGAVVDGRIQMLGR